MQKIGRPFIRSNSGLVTNRLLSTSQLSQYNPNFGSQLSGISQQIAEIKRSDNPSAGVCSTIMREMRRKQTEADYATQFGLYVSLEELDNSLHAFLTGLMIIN